MTFLTRAELAPHELPLFYTPECNNVATTTALDFRIDVSILEFCVIEHAIMVIS
jgi:hypothetical protein